MAREFPVKAIEDELGGPSPEGLTDYEPPARLKGQRSTCGLAIINQKIARTAPNAGNPKASIGPLVQPPLAAHLMLEVLDRVGNKQLLAGNARICQRFVEQAPDRALGPSPRTA